MGLLIFVFLTAAAGAYFTSIGCRRSREHGRRAGWHLILVGTCGAALLTALFVGQGDLFHPNRDIGKLPVWLEVAVMSAIAGIVALASSVVVVVYFRANYRHEDPKV